MNNANEGGLRAPERSALGWEKEEYWDLDKLDDETRRQFDVCHGCKDVSICVIAFLSYLILLMKVKHTN